MAPLNSAAEAAPVDELAALETRAQELESGDVAGGAPGNAAAAPAEPAPNTAEELREALVCVRLMAAPMFTWWPEFGSVWSDSALNGIATSGAVIMDRHGWTMGDLVGTYGPYLAFVAATAPPSLATWQAMRSRRAAREAEAAARLGAEGTRVVPEPAPAANDGRVRPSAD